MKAVPFTKMQGSGNDFVVMDARCGKPVSCGASFVASLCDRVYGIGADGLLWLERSKKADARMRIFNADGSEAEMCGNGARCAAYFLGGRKTGGKARKKLTLETKAGIIAAEITKERVKIRLTDPVDLKFDLHVSVGGKDYEVDYLNTGVPHAVVAVDDLEHAPVKEIGRQIRHHEAFHPAGTNVDFIKILDKDHVAVRTYERGVEDETLACGTGSVASGIMAVLNTCGGCGKNPDEGHKVFVKTRSGETLIVYFKASKKKITDVWLEGWARMVFKGEYILG
jgi:diaminopimelate epimerase